MVTHDDHLASYADRIFHIRDGKILKIEETNQKREDVYKRQRSTSEESENAKATGESTQESYEIVMNIYKHYSDSDMSNAAMVEELIKVNPDSLGTIGLERYNEMTEKMCIRDSIRYMV